MLIPKLKDPDPNPSVTISVLAAIGEQAQVFYFGTTAEEIRCVFDDI